MECVRSDIKEAISSMIISTTPERTEYEINDKGDVMDKMDGAHEDKKGDLETFDNVIDLLGGFGHWQRIIFFVICLADIFGAMSMMIPVFVGATPRWYCVDDWTNTTSDDNITSVNITLRSYLTASSSCSCSVRVFQDDFTSIVSQWDLVCGHQYVSDLITSVQFCGLLLGVIVGGQLSDVVGRKLPYFSSFLLNITSGVISAFSPNWQLYATCRFLVGVGFGSQQVINCVYPLEFVGRRWRSLCGTVGFWAVGQLILALAAYGVRQWRFLILVTTAPGYIYILLWWIVPESPRWLVQKRRFSQAHVVLQKISRKHKKPCPDIEELSKLCVVDKTDTKKTIKVYTYWDIVNNWRYGKITLITMFAWFSTYLVYYQLAFNIRNLSGDRYVNVAISGVIDFVIMLSVIPVSNIFGRRLGFLLYAIIALVGSFTLLGIFVSGKESALDELILATALVGKAGALGACYICQIYSAEVFPTVVRNVGSGAGSVAGRVGTILAPQMVLLGMYHSSAPYIISSLLCLITAPLFYLLRETKDLGLEDHM